MKNIQLGDQLLLQNVFENFDFEDTLFSKVVPNFCLPGIMPSNKTK